MDTARSWYDTWAGFPQPKKVDVLKKIAFGFYALFLLVLVIYGFGRTGARERTPPAVVVFMDVDSYDLQALRYLAQRRDVALAMLVLSRSAWSAQNVTTSLATLRNFVALLKHEGYDADTLQITYSNHTDPDSSSDDVTLADDALTDAFEYEAALDKLLAVRAATLLVLGSCTEVAHFLRTHPERRARVQSIVVAGGAFRVEGDVARRVPQNTRAERNFYLDAPAANYVTLGEHGRPVTLLPLDAVVPWQAAAYDTLVTSRLHAPHTSAGVVADKLQAYYDALDTSRKPVALAVLAACYVADAQLQSEVNVTRMVVSVLHDGNKANQGRSVRPANNPFNQMTTVVLGLPQDTFWQHLVRVDALPM